MEWLIIAAIWIVTLGGSFIGGWFAKPPTAQIQEINTDTTIEVNTTTKTTIMTVMSTEVYNFPEKVWGSAITNTNDISNFIKSVVTNTNAYTSKTNTRITNW